MDVCSELGVCKCAYGYGMVSVNMRNVIKVTSLGDELREVLNIGCQWRVFCVQRIVTNMENRPLKGVRIIWV